jgi:hypothetical protein
MNMNIQLSEAAKQSEAVSIQKHREIKQDGFRSKD